MTAKPLRVQRGTNIDTSPGIFSMIEKLSSKVETVSKSIAELKCLNYSADKQYKFCTNTDGSSVDVISSISSAIGVIRDESDICTYGFTYLKTEGPCKIDNILIPSTTGLGKVGTNDEVFGCLIKKIPTARVIAITDVPNLVLCLI